MVGVGRVFLRSPKYSTNSIAMSFPFVASRWPTWKLARYCTAVCLLKKKWYTNYSVEAFVLHNRLYWAVHDGVEEEVFIISITQLFGVSDWRIGVSDLHGKGKEIDLEMQFLYERNSVMKCKIKEAKHEVKWFGQGVVGITVIGQNGIGNRM